MENGTYVAKRSFSLLKKHSNQNLRVRPELLSKLHHPHLVSLLGYCFDSSGQDDPTSTKVFVIYEYVPNGNYRTYLSETCPEKHLNWSARLAILIGVAKAVHFLQVGMIPGTVSNRLKTNNILLDEHRIAKLSDYGLSILSEEAEKVEAKGDVPKSGEGMISVNFYQKVPSVGPVLGDGKVEFNESFRLPVTLLRDTPDRGKDPETFQKNCVEFNLYEPRRDQLLATAVIDLAEYGVIKEAISISAALNSKRSLRSTPQPILHIRIQPVDKRRTSSSSRDALPRVVSMDRNGGESVSALMNEEYAEEAEVTSSAADDASSHSSVTNSSLAHQNEENGADRTMDRKGGIIRDQAAVSTLGTEKRIALQENLYGSSPGMSPANGHSSLLILPDHKSNPSFPLNVHPASSASTHPRAEEEANRSDGDRDFIHVHGKATNGRQLDENLGDDSQDEENNGTVHSAEEDSVESETEDEIDDCSMEKMIMKKQPEHKNPNLENEKNSSDDEQTNILPQQASNDEGSLRIDTYSFSEGMGLKGNILKMDGLKLVKSVRSSSDSVRSNGLVSRNQHNEMKDVNTLQDARNRTRVLRFEGRKNAKIYPKDARTTILDSKMQHLEHRIKMLEEELREAAAGEAALYSVVAEHGRSMSKVHAPARRLSRLYIHACTESSLSRRGIAAKSAISGLILVAKACGNDVPRLTFWLSNSVVLRSIICQAVAAPELQLSAKPHKEKNGGANGNNIILTSLKWKQSPSRKENSDPVSIDSADWEDPRTFIELKLGSSQEQLNLSGGSLLRHTCKVLLQRTWKNLLVLVQGRTLEELQVQAGDQDHVNFSLDLWKNAFRDACERHCPVRAGGHECGCLRMLTRLIMEQCVVRLEVEMFNAILRESDDEIPTDPVSDPISDSKVLPIPAGKSSFGAGAQLKNAIGNWSRWLTDLFGIDDDDNDTLEDENDADDEESDTTFKSFYVLNALSDLMMLPKDMLLRKSIRKEVCPTFGTSLIKTLLDSFITDEFCPEPIPKVVFEALEDAEDALEAGEESVTTIPCVAAPPIYLPPSSPSVAGIIGQLGNQAQLRRSGSSVLRKSYTSDDELDELNSPLASILHDGPPSSPALTKLGQGSKEKLYQTCNQV